MHRLCPATNVIVIGASAGGIAAVRTLLNRLPEKIPAAIFVVVHTSPDGPARLAAVLNRATRLRVVSPDDGMSMRDGYVYVAPPDYHLIMDGRLLHRIQRMTSRSSASARRPEASKHLPSF